MARPYTSPPAYVSPLNDIAGKKLLFAGDHILWQDWITAEGIRLTAMLHVYKRQARELSERICVFVKDLADNRAPIARPERGTDRYGNGTYKL